METDLFLLKYFDYPCGDINILAVCCLLEITMFDRLDEEDKSISRYSHPFLSLESKVQSRPLRPHGCFGGRAEAVPVPLGIFISMKFLNGLDEPIEISLSSCGYFKFDF